MIATDPEAFASATNSFKIKVLQQRMGLPDQYIDDLQRQVAPLALALQRHAQETARPILVGLNGCQGSGKSTLAQFLATMLHVGADMHCAIVSLDDFYLEKSARQKLAHDVHPLLLTRGVPGTHDLPLVNTTLDALLDPKRETAVRVPIFNKATDDREPRENWSSIAPGVDLVLLEGWCVGCPAQRPQALIEPANALERDEDPDGIWRRFVNDALANGYQTLFQRLDLLIMLAAPSFDCVYAWRDQQEQQLAQSLPRGDEVTTHSQLLTGQTLRRFIRHFERLTCHQLSALAHSADGVIELASNHRMVAHHGRLFA